MIKPYEQVVYTENGKEHLATVLAVRTLDHQVGVNGEPHIHLGFFAPVLKPAFGSGKLEESSVIGTHDQGLLANFRFDVLHNSHPKATGASWKELSDPE